ncbi:molybdate ABC transporter substrate-binding protein [Shimia ponticola]|uniref:molybdate ABC transporter substrate-binding protein n=1 Tax=Shimia ponticola TaxID=2582893 RepID=UPI0011BE3EBB|nr:molybdate ABC transporter substrate-binding protein [Shimia ponticola]
MRALILILICLVCPQMSAADVLRVSAAASLKGPLDQAVTEFEAQTGHSVRVSYAASSLLARQIVQGAQADVFWSANQVWIEYLSDQGVIIETAAPLRNGIALASNQTLGSDIAALCETGRIVTARTDAVPLGQYVKSALSASGDWPLPSGCLVETDNARAALIAVLRGEVAAGFLYSSDIAQNGLTTVSVLDPPEPVLYPIASLSPAGAEISAFLQSDAGLRPFLTVGFQANDR